MVTASKLPSFSISLQAAAARGGGTGQRMWAGRRTQGPRGKQPATRTQRGEGQRQASRAVLLPGFSWALLGEGGHGGPVPACTQHPVAAWGQGARPGGAPPRPLRFEQAGPPPGSNRPDACAAEQGRGNRAGASLQGHKHRGGLDGAVPLWDAVPAQRLAAKHEPCACGEGNTGADASPPRQAGRASAVQARQQLNAA